MTNTLLRSLCTSALAAGLAISAGTAPALAQGSSLPDGMSSHLSPADRDQFRTDPLGAVLNQSLQGSTNALHQSVGATMFASFYSTGYLSPLWGWSGAAADAARCADTISGSSNSGGIRFAAAVACVVPNPRLSAALDAQFRQTGHF
ncbi:hypothetical protein [Corynebacterium epidermidicanis]|uniref:Secreted protein n=1 Tax=Corynebacterium epidermidicanis TaxID=1050174 RepID=A0A0G3GNK8_9CORY|nr:hypothetical protein [Corynebacterium epidermidicanis]AKK02729.1 hypothetical protein CEPID_04285 [Corynebacterium epidermidicanis]